MLPLLNEKLKLEDVAKTAPGVPAVADNGDAIARKTVIVIDSSVFLDMAVSLSFTSLLKIVLICSPVPSFLERGRRNARGFD